MIVAEPAGWLLPLGLGVAAAVVVTVLLTIERRRAIALVVSLAAVLAGILTAAGAFGPASFGSFAYAPLSDSAFPIGFSFVRPAGLLIGASGVFGVGVVVGAARRPSTNPPPSGPTT